jgi:hypothetical protein
MAKVLADSAVHRIQQACSNVISEAPVAKILAITCQ